jgi:hypothetical protein
MLRCRLRTAWSLSAKVALCSMLGFELVVIGFVWHMLPWIWFLVLTVPMFAWYVNHNRHDLQRLIAVVLDDIAKKNGLIKLNREKPSKP